MITVTNVGKIHDASQLFNLMYLKIEIKYYNYSRCGGTMKGYPIPAILVMYFASLFVKIRSYRNY